MIPRIRRSRLGLFGLGLLSFGVFGGGCAAPTDVACADAETGCEETTASSDDELVVFTINKKRWQRTSPFQDRAKLQTTLANLDAANTSVVDMTSSASGAWVILTADAYYTGGTLPPGMSFWLSLMKSNGQELRAVDINSEDGYVIAGDTSYHFGGNVNQLAKDKVAQYYANGWKIRDVELTTNGYVVLGDGNLVSYANTGTELMKVLADRLKSKRRVEQVEIGHGGGWVVVSDQESAVASMPAIVQGSLKAAAKDQAHISKLMLGPDDGFVLYSNGTAFAGANVMEAIEYGSGGQNIWERMDFYGVPGVSIAVIEGNQVKYARGYGVLKQREEAHVLATTAFDMASLSKFIGALTVMKASTTRGSGFTVDDSVVDDAVPGGIVEGWLEEGNTNGASYGFPNTTVSSNLALAHFMRHQTDIVPSGGSPGITRGNPVLPVGVSDLLLGYDCDKSPCGYNGLNFAWSAGGAGPVGSSYDSANFLVPQAVVEDHTGKKAWQLIDEYFVGPMGLNYFTGNTGSALLQEGKIAWQHDANGPRNSQTVYPWTFAGGIYAAPMDYAEMMILALNQGRDSSGVQRLPAAAINRMLQVQNGNVGFGLFAGASSNITEANDVSFRHSGSHGGRTRTYMCGNPTRDAGIVITMNADISDGPDAGNGNDTTDLRQYIMAEFLQYVGWTC